MAKINFPNNRDQLVPPLPTGALQDGDTTNITADGVTITYVFKKPGAPNTDSWWKSMGRVNNATPLDKIEEGNSSVEVIDTGSNGQVVVTTDGDARMKVTNNGTVKLNGTNINTNPSIQLNPDGSGTFGGDVFTTARILAGSNGYGSTGVSLNGSVGSVYCRPSNTNTAAYQVYSGTGGAASDIEFQVNGDGKLTIGDPTDPEISLNADGSASFAGPVTSYRFSYGAGAIYFPGDPAIFGSANSSYIYNGSNSPDDGTYFANTPFTSNADLTALMANDGSFRLGGTLPGSPNISLNAEGSAEFAAGDIFLDVDGSATFTGGLDLNKFATTNYAKQRINQFTTIILKKILN